MLTSKNFTFNSLQKRPAHFVIQTLKFRNISFYTLELLHE